MTLELDDITNIIHYCNFTKSLPHVGTVLPHGGLLVQGHDKTEIMSGTNKLQNKLPLVVYSPDILNVSRRNDVTEEEIQRMIEDIAEEITEPDLSELKRLGIDEIALVKGQKNYCAVLVNLDTGKLIAILEKRTQEELRETLTGWGKEVLEQIK